MTTEKYWCISAKFDNFDNKYVSLFAFYHCTMGTKSSKCKIFWSKLNCMNLPVLWSNWFLLKSKWHLVSYSQSLVTFFLEVIESQAFWHIKVQGVLLHGAYYTLPWTHFPFLGSAKWHRNEMLLANSTWKLLPHCSLIHLGCRKFSYPCNSLVKNYCL